MYMCVFNCATLTHNPQGATFVDELLEGQLLEVYFVFVAINPGKGNILTIFVFVCCHSATFLLTQCHIATHAQLSRVTLGRTSLPGIK